MTASEDLVTANYILYDQGILDSFGHVSVRDPANPSIFLLSRNLAPGLVTIADILRFDLKGEVQGPETPAVYLERFIHAAIYELRPDVQAVVHSHAPSVVPFGLVAKTLCPVCHMGGFIGPGAPIYEIRDHAGEASDMLIRSIELGRSLALTLGEHCLVLMRGHGMTTVGTNLPEAVFRAVYTDVNARIQLAASQLGVPTCLNEAEATAADAANVGQIKRAWDFWARRSRAAIAALD